MVTTFRLNSLVTCTPTLKLIYLVLQHFLCVSSNMLKNSLDSSGISHCYLSHTLLPLILGVRHHFYSHPREAYHRLWPTQRKYIPVCLDPPWHCSNRFIFLFTGLSLINLYCYSRALRNFCVVFTALIKSDLKRHGVNVSSINKGQAVSPSDFNFQCCLSSLLSAKHAKHQEAQPC